MAISFTNTSGTGYNYVNGGSGPATTDVPAVATPSDAGNGKLLVAVWGAVWTTLTAQNPSLPNVTGETLITSIRNVGSPNTVEAHAFYAALSSSPTNLNWNESTGGDRRPTGLGLIFSGHDTTTPIAASATNSGTGTTLTFPTTSSVSDGDYVLRVAIAANDGVTTSFSSFTGTTTVINAPQSGDYKNALFVGYSVKSGSGTPGTDTVTINTSRNWVTFTLVVKAAGASGLTITSIVPAQIDSGESFTINGSGFGATQGLSLVQVGGVTQPVTSWGPTQIVCTATRGSQSMGNATLTIYKM